jgi:hypothetical protein
VFPEQLFHQCAGTFRRIPTSDDAHFWSTTMGLRKCPVVCPDLGSGFLVCCFPLSLNAISFVALFRCVSTSYCSGDTTRVGNPRFISLYSAQALISSAPNCFLRSSNSQACFRLRNSMFLVGENQWQRELSSSPLSATSNSHPIPGGFLPDFDELASIEVLLLLFIDTAPIFLMALCPMALVTSVVFCPGSESRLYLKMLVVFFNSAKAMDEPAPVEVLFCLLSTFAGVLMALSLFGLVTRSRFGRGVGLGLVSCWSYW